MTISWRLTLLFSLILCVTLVMSGLTIYTLTERFVSNNVDDNLRTFSNEIHDILKALRFGVKPDYNIVLLYLPHIDRFASPGVYIQLVNSDGNVVVKSENLGDQALPVNMSSLADEFASTASFETIDTGNNARVRVMTSPIYVMNENLLLELGYSLKDADATMNLIRWAIVGGSLVALLLATISSRIFFRRAFSTVKSITKTAQGIESGADLSRRVGYKGPKDEIGQLATTFDHMIEHLDKVFKSQKQFVTDASHDLRSPLTVLRGNLDLLKLNMTKEDRQESLRAMGVELDRMAIIVNDLLLLAEVESGQISRQREVSLKDIVADGAERARQLAGNRTVAVRALEDLSVVGDDHMLQRLLSNLVDNAIAHTPETGTITLSLFRDGEWARLEVGDNGSGIDPEHLTHIFDRFYKVDQARSQDRERSGLGLAIVKAIAEQHQGKVAVASELGKGSTFTAWLRLDARSIWSPDKV